MKLVFMSINIQKYIEPIILKIISEKDQYGYGIIHDIEEVSNGKFILNEQTLYTVLHRLVKNEYAEQYWSDDITNGGRRKYYKITEKGKKVLFNYIDEWDESKNIINYYLQK